MGEPERMLIDYLKSSMDNLASKFDKFLEAQELANVKARETEAIVHEHDTRLAKLETPADKWLLANHPMLYDWARVLSIAGITIAMFHFFPKVANWLGALVA